MIRLLSLGPLSVNLLKLLVDTEALVFTSGKNIKHFLLCNNCLQTGCHSFQAKLEDYERCSQ